MSISLDDAIGFLSVTLLSEPTGFFYTAFNGVTGRKPVGSDDGALTTEPS